MHDEIELHTDQRPFVMVYYDFLDYEGLDIYEEKVFICLKRRADNRTHECFPSLQTICEDARISKDKVVKSLKKLEEIGAISIRKRRTKKHGNIANVYRINDTAYQWTGKRGSSKEYRETQAAYLLEQLELLGYDVTLKEKTEPSAENSENITYMEKAPVLSTDQSESTDTHHKTTASTEEETALFFDNDTTEPVENASANVEAIAAEIEASAPGLLSPKDRKAAARELVKHHPAENVESLCSMAAEIARRTDSGYHAGKVLKPAAYMMRSLQRAKPTNGSNNPAPMGGSLSHERKSSNAMQAFLDSLKDDNGGGGNGG